MEKTPDSQVAANGSTTNYINNPFTLAVEGMKLLFRNAPSVAILLVILVALGAGAYTFNNPSQDFTDTQSATPNTINSIEIEPAMILLIVGIGSIVLFITIVITSIFNGVFAYTSAELTKGREVSLKQAFKAVFARFWSFVWLQILMFVKLFLWTLLFIVPGFVMSYRYSLANISFFDSDKKLKGNAAIKDSLALTRGAWITTFGAQTLFNIITFGLIKPIMQVASTTILYRQFNEIMQAGAIKPKSHILSKVTLILFIVAIVVIFVVIFFLMWAIINYVNDQVIQSPVLPLPPVSV